MGICGECSYDGNCKWREDGKCTWHDVIKPPMVAVDLDGVIAEFDGWTGIDDIGEPREEAKYWLKRFDEMNYLVIVWTTRGNTEVIREYLEEHDIFYDHINWNPYQAPDMSVKIYADAYIDDGNLFFVDDWDEIGHAVVRKFGYYNGEGELIGNYPEEVSV